MNIGFFIKWDKFSLSRSGGNVIGDELLGESLSKSIREIFPSIDAQVYAPNFQPSKVLDIAIYLNEGITKTAKAKKHLFYLQNGFPDKNYKFPTHTINSNYDGLICFSHLMLKKIQSALSIPSCYLPFGVDVDFFKPQDYDPKLDFLHFDVSYIGNDIKGEEATMRYLYPAIDFNFGLFGNWKIQRSKLRFWRNFKKLPPYKKVFEQISRGKIPQEQVPYLYTHSKINLNFTLQSCIDWDVITLRTFEVLACQGFLISDKVPLAEKEMKDCMIFTDGNQDLKDKIAYFLKNSQERKEIAQSGYTYVKQHSSIQEKAKELIEFLQKEIL